MLSIYFLRIFITTFCFYTSVMAQEGWFSQSAGYEYGHYAVYFVDADTGWVSMEGGSIIKTTNGGDNWTAKWINNNYHPTDLYFINSKAGWMTADNMRIFKTEDSGEIWFLQFENTSPSSVRSYCTLRSVYFVDDQIGYAVGGLTNAAYVDSALILKTINGGVNWTFQYAGDHNFYLFSVFFVDSDHGWICGDEGHIFYTSDGGINWNPQNSGTDQRLWSIYFVNQSTGWIVGEGGTILTTDNSGADWNSQQSPTNNHLFSLCFVNEWIGYACGVNGTIVKTMEAGADWSAQVSGSDQGLMDVYFVSPDTGYVVGWFGTILKTINGGIGTNYASENIPIIPSELILYQNNPNPFNPVTTIKFQIPNSSFTTLKVYNILAEEVATLESTKLNQGSHTYQFNGKNLASGIYYYQLVSGEFHQVKKMILLN